MAKQDKNYTVKGTITNQNGQPQQGLIIRATDKDFTGENALGSPDSTDASGVYSIVYDSDDFVIEGKETTVADLIVRAFDSTGLLQNRSFWNYYISDNIKNAQKAERGTTDIYMKVEKDKNTKGIHFKK